MWQYQNTDELYHYGILGMRWGMRRAYNKGTTYQYKSMGQKKWEKKVAKISSKVDKIKAQNKKPSFSTQLKLDNAKNKLNMYKGRDKNREDYAKTANFGKGVAKFLLFGPLGAGNYNRFRSAGHGRISSAIGSSYVASTFGYPITLFISKSEENKAGKLRSAAEMKREV